MVRITRRAWRLLSLIAIVLGLLLVGSSLAYLLARQPDRPPVVANAQTPMRIIDPSPFQAPLPAASPFPGSKALADGLRVQMPELGIDLPVIGGDGINAPLYKAAHYPGMAWPGGGGRSLLYGHARPGMFGPLFHARVGQEVDVTRPDGFKLRYKVTEYYADWPVNDLRWFQPADFEQLVLSTCTTYSTNDPRIVVIARPV